MQIRFATYPLTMSYLRLVYVKKAHLLENHVHLLIILNAGLHKIPLHHHYSGKHITVVILNYAQYLSDMIIQLVQIAVHMFISILKIKVKI